LDFRSDRALAASLRIRLSQLSFSSASSCSNLVNGRGPAFFISWIAIPAFVSLQNCGWSSLPSLHSDWKWFPVLLSEDLPESAAARLIHRRGICCPIE
jgi:hypothetical protein